MITCVVKASPKLTFSLKGLPSLHPLLISVKCSFYKKSFKLGKSKDTIKYIYLSFVSFLPLFYLCCIYYWDSLIFCCQFVANFIILRIYHFTSIIYIAHLYKSPHTFVIILFPKIQFLISIIFFTIFYSLLCPLVISSTSRKLRS